MFACCNHVLNTTIMWISGLIFLLSMPILWAYRDSLAFPTVNKNYWHWVGFILRTAPAFLIIQNGYLTIAYGFYFWIFFELAINYFTKKDLFYMDKSTLSGEILHSFYLNGKVIFAIKLALMIIFLTIKFI
jgi:hypothetical protein